MRALLVLAFAVACSCEVLTPPPPPKAPQPGTYLSTPFPDVRALNDVLVLQPGLAYAVGTDGTILKLTGTAWSKEPSGVTDDLQAITGFLEDDGTGTGAQKEVMMAVGHNGTVLQRTAPGAWGVLPSGTTNVLFSVAMLSDQDAFIVGDAGTILRFQGATNTLTPQLDQTLQDVVGTTCPTNGCGGSAVCGGDGKCHSFFPIPEPLKGVGGVSGTGDVLVVGARGAVYRYDTTRPDDASNRWTREKSGTTRSLASIFAKNGVWIPATDGVLLLRNGADDYNDAANRTPAPVFLQDVWVDGSDIFAVGLSQEIFHRNSSLIWDLTTVSLDAEMRGIDGFDAPPDDDPSGPAQSHFIAVGGGGRIVRGPLVLPVAGETALKSRLANGDFVNNP